MALGPAPVHPRVAARPPSASAARRSGEWPSSCASPRGAARWRTAASRMPRDARSMST